MQQIANKILIVLGVLWLTCINCLADDLEYDSDGRLKSSGISAKVAANFPDTTVGTAIIFNGSIFTTPTLNLRYRVVPLPKKSWQRLVTPDYLSIGLGAEHILSSLQWELLPELLTVGGGIAYSTLEDSIYAVCDLQFLEF